MDLEAKLERALLRKQASFDRIEYGVRALFLLLPAIEVAGSANDIAVGSFNIEWFGHGNKPRTNEQIRLLAVYIESLEADILACQETNPSGDTSGNSIADWEDLKRELGTEYEI